MHIHVLLFFVGITLLDWPLKCLCRHLCSACLLCTFKRQIATDSILSYYQLVVTSIKVMK